MSQGASNGLPTAPLKAVYASYEQFESSLSKAMDELVATNGFAELFTTTATTTMALTKMVNGALDQAVRSTRFAARQDVVALARQLSRTEDKLERLLQAVENLQDQISALEPQAPPAPRPAPRRRPATKRTARKTAP